MSHIPDFVRPGGKPYVSPEGIVYGTDGKLRWAYEFHQHKQPTVLWAKLRKYMSLCAVVGVLILLLQVGSNGMVALPGALLVLAGLLVAGAVVAGIAFGVHLLENGPIVCLLFTLDEESLSCQQVKGKTDKEKVQHAFAEWVGGQSQPSLRVCAQRSVRLNQVKSLAADPEGNRIRLRGAKRAPVVYAEPQQFQVVLDALNKSVK